jgi:hypothetical protein
MAEAVSPSPAAGASQPPGKSRLASAAGTWLPAAALVALAVSSSLWLESLSTTSAR